MVFQKVRFFCTSPRYIIHMIITGDAPCCKRCTLLQEVQLAAKGRTIIGVAVCCNRCHLLQKTEVIVAAAKEATICRTQLYLKSLSSNFATCCSPILTLGLGCHGIFVVSGPAVCILGALTMPCYMPYIHLLLWRQEYFPVAFFPRERFSNDSVYMLLLFRAGWG